MRRSLKQIADSLKMMWALDRAVFLTSIAISMIDACIPFVGILLSAYVLDQLTAGTRDIWVLILTAVIAVGGVFFLTGASAYLKKIKEVHTELCVRRFDMKMCERTLTMDYELLDSPKVNDIRARIRNDNSWGAGFYSMIGMLPWLLSSAIGLLASIAILIPLFLDANLFDDPLALALLGLFLAVVAGNGWFTSANKKKSYAFLNQYSNEKSFFGHFLWGSIDYRSGKDIRIYDAKPLIEGYIDRDPPYRNYMLPLVRLSAVGGFANGLSSGLLMTLSYLFVALRAISGAFGAGAVVKYAATIYRFSSALNDTIAAFTEYSVAAARQQSTMEYMNVPNVLYKGTLPVEKRRDNEYEIEFRNVSFQYPGSDACALRNLNLRLRIGERLAVVGMNGSGKTTMIKLLCRLYDPTEGEITLNGIDIKKYRYDEYMSLFSVVFQDFKLFSFPLGQNVATSVEPDGNKVVDCLDQAGLSARLSAMPKGLETPLNQDFEEDGVEISGGEAQKIALARALYKDAPFIVLDEPTAALDPVAEFEVYSKFNEIVGDRTAVYISHRLSSCRFCDRIAVFDEGALVQTGSHEVLLSDEGGRYFALWNAQARYYDVPRAENARPEQGFGPGARIDISQ